MLGAGGRDDNLRGTGHVFRYWFLKPFGESAGQRGHFQEEPQVPGGDTLGPAGLRAPILLRGFQGGRKRSVLKESQDLSHP